MRVSVDATKCQAHNRCVMFAPELFVMDDLGYVSVPGDGVVPPDEEDNVRLAEANCPEFAVIVTDE
jgi:ferredoxin